MLGSLEFFQFSSKLQYFFIPLSTFSSDCKTFDSTKFPENYDLQIFVILDRFLATLELKTFRCGSTDPDSQLEPILQIRRIPKTIFRNLNLMKKNLFFISTSWKCSSLN